MFVLLAFIAIIIAASGLSFSTDDSDGLLHDGYYTAEMADYSDGWKEYLTIYVNNGRVIAAEYDGRNESGFVKSWDMEHARIMNQTDGALQHKYMRFYVSELVARQSSEGIEAMSGATNSYRSFKRLVDAAILQARTGVSEVVFVDINHGKR